MVEILFPSKDKSGVHQGVGRPAPSVTSSILRPPIPPLLEAVGRFAITQADVNVMSAHPQLGGELSRAATEALGKKCSADYVLVNGNVLCGLDSQDTVHYYAVGKKMDAIALRHGTEVARKLLDILGDSPLDILTPRKQLDECEHWNGYDDDPETWSWRSTEKSIGSLYPRWSWAKDKDWFGEKREKRRPKPIKVPKELEKMMDDCVTAYDVITYKEQTFWPDYDEAQPFPFATICWESGHWAPDWLTKQYCQTYGNIPEKTMGDDPSWVHLVPSFRNGMENGAMMFIPHAPFHSEDALLEFLRQCRPYITLLDYISHECS